MTAKIVFASDLAPIRKFSSVMKEQPSAIYGDLLPVLQQADYRIVNLESPLYNPQGFITKSGAAFSGEPEHIASLRAGDFNAAICANNHTFDCGWMGFDSTRKLLHENQIATVGAGEDLAAASAPLEFSVNGIRAALFAISEGEDMLGAKTDSFGVNPWHVSRLAAEIREAKQKFDIVLVSAHCGLEYQPYPSFYVYEAFRCWAEAGADLIIGHHPHVPQGMTCFGNTPAYFSLGNFAFYQPVDLFYRKIGYLLEFEISEKGLVSHKTVPYRIKDDALALLAGEDLACFNELFAELSRPLENEKSAREAWHAVLAYNGIAGFEAELEKILATLRETPAKGAAMLRNRVTCVQHSTQWIDGMSRIADGSIADAPAELIEMVRRFMTRRIEA